MHRAFYDEMREPISKIDKEILTWTYRKDEDDSEDSTALDVDTTISGDDDVSR
mgnify:FL=1